MAARRTLGRLRGAALYHEFAGLEEEGSTAKAPKNAKLPDLVFGALGRLGG
jgi:hypothetical protein